MTVVKVRDIAASYTTRDVKDKREKYPTKTNEEQENKTRPTTADGNEENNANTYTAKQVENISLMVLPAEITNGSKKLRVNVMLDPCSTGSYINESAAEELQLEGHVQNLTISGTAGTEVKKLSRRVELSVGDVNGRFQVKLEANVLNDITGNTPAIKWSEIKHQWPHLKCIPFQTIAK